MNRKQWLGGWVAGGALVGAIAIVAACSGDSVVTTSCGDGSQLCGSSCTPLARDPENCGACGKKCGAGEVCSQGACALACAGGTTKCGSSCVDTKSDGTNCGACGTKCGAGEVCNAGKCAGSCGAGSTTCGSSCVSTQTDQVNCGGCGNICKGGEQCVAGKCQISCQSGLSLCTVQPSDAGVSDASLDATSDATSDAATLGATYCANLQTDTQNCGGCGTTCTQGQQCVGGTCAATCGNGVTLCKPDGGAPYCANLQSENSNCGTCGNACASGQICLSGICKTMKVYGPMHTFANLTTDHYITQGSCSLGQGQAADADYFCKHFYANTCVALPGFVAHTTPTATYVKMHKNGGCTNNGTDIPNTTCQGGPCKIGNWSEVTAGLANLLCLCP